MTIALPSLTKRYLAAVLDGDRQAAVRLVLDEGVGAGHSVADLYLQVIQPAQREIGCLWAENRLTVAEEHLATGISQLVLAHLYPSLPREPSNGKSVLIGCVAGELHEMGARVAADFFEMAGFTVRYLGANVPTESLVAMAREQPPDLVLLSATMTFHIPALREAVARLREALGQRSILAVGGQVLAWAPDLPAQLGIELAGGDADAMVAAARRALLAAPP
jgi:methanogenic corrinoid protein MtbC1